MLCVEDAGFTLVNEERLKITEAVVRTEVSPVKLKKSAENDMIETLWMNI